MKKFILTLTAVMTMVGTTQSFGETKKTVVTHTPGKTVIVTTITNNNVKPMPKPVKRVEFCDCGHCKTKKNAKKCLVGKRGEKCTCKECKRFHKHMQVKPQPKPTPKPQPRTWRDVK